MWNGLGSRGSRETCGSPNASVNVAAARNLCRQVQRDPPLTFNRLFVRVVARSYPDPLGNR